MSSSPRSRRLGATLLLVGLLLSSLEILWAEAHLASTSTVGAVLDPGADDPAAPGSPEPDEDDCPCLCACDCASAQLVALSTPPAPPTPPFAAASIPCSRAVLLSREPTGSWRPPRA